MVSPRLNRAALRCALASVEILALVAGIEARADKPSVQVRFEIKVPSFATLPEHTTVEQNVRDRLSRELERRLGFATWSGSTPPQGSAPLGRLVLRLEQDPTTQPMPRIYVTWLGAGPTGNPADLKMERIEIYAATNPSWDTNDRRAFEARLLDMTLPTVDTDAFRDVLVEKFFRRLPISSVVEAQARDRVVEVPIRWNEFLLASDSKLAIRFTKLADQREGSLMLSFIEPRLAAAGAAGGFPARVRGSITQGEFDGHPLTLNENWNDTVPDLLAGAKTSCVIFEYKPRDEAMSPLDEELLGL